MSTPIIGITIFQNNPTDKQPTVELNTAYVVAVLRAGGLPVLIPPQVSPLDTLELLERFDGLIFSGGADIDPRIFGGRPHPRVYGIDAERDALELALLPACVQHDVPFLGICRGIQSLNVALGGTLYTDISDQLEGAIKHDYYPGYARSHEAHQVHIAAGSRLNGIVGVTTLPVNSLHHQGLEQAAPGLEVVARAPDGLIEAVELPGHRFGLGVQWHPEAMPASEPMQAIFQSLVSAARS